MSLERQDAHEDEWDEESEYAPRSIFAAGWFRAVLVLTVLAIVVVVALPYLLNWFEPAPAGMKVAPPKPSAPAAPIATAPLAPSAAVRPSAPLPASSAPSAAMPGKPAAAREPSGGRYWVQLGLFKDGTNAEHLAQTLRAQGFAVEVARVTRPDAGGVPAGTYHLVRAGGFGDQSRALAARNALREKGFVGFLTEGVAQ